ncbi:GH36 C-terminal domain-containing protein [Streptomyces sp. NRRL B-24572]|uniref:GH36 C-terminal domain-containing protein n=1 Tax=Streptomyces sp. NRRL B-24572 TaxID=1962156 RepID=UPI000A36C520
MAYLEWDHNRDLSEDRRHALFTLAQLTASTDSVPPRLRLPGLDPDLTYTVTVRPEFPFTQAHPSTAAPWITHGTLRARGAVLAALGPAAPLLDPAQCLVLEVRATDDPDRG